jgi:hypothetical protein
MDNRFAGDEVSLGLLMEEELIRAAQLEMMRLLTLQQERDLMRGAWVSGAEGVEVYPGGYATSP